MSYNNIQTRAAVIKESTNRLKRYGSQAISNNKLLAIITGNKPNQLKQQYPSLTDLSRASITKLCHLPGIGQQTAAKLHAAFELGRRLYLESYHDRIRADSPNTIANLLMPQMSHYQQEHLVVVLLNTKNYITKVHTVYKGMINTVHIRISEIFQEPIKSVATKIVIAHNHPSGDPAPSPEDIAITEKIYQAGQLLGIKLLDHIIIGNQAWTSLKDQKLGFPTSFQETETAEQKPKKEAKPQT